MHPQKPFVQAIFSRKLPGKFPTIGISVTAAILILGTAGPAVSGDGLIDPGIYGPKPVVHTADARSREDRAMKPKALPVPETWQSLRRGMTRAQAAALVGEPRWEEKTLAFDFWMYQSESIMAAGVLVFDGERLSSWRPPDRPL